MSLGFSIFNFFSPFLFLLYFSSFTFLFAAVIELIFGLLAVKTCIVVLNKMRYKLELTSQPLVPRILNKKEVNMFGQL